MITTNDQQKCRNFVIHAVLISRWEFLNLIPLYVYNSHTRNDELWNSTWNKQLRIWFRYSKLPINYVVPPLLPPPSSSDYRGTNSIFYLNHRFVLLFQWHSTIHVLHLVHFSCVKTIYGWRVRLLSTVFQWIHDRCTFPFFLYPAAAGSPSKLNNDRLHDVKNEGSTD